MGVCNCSMFCCALLCVPSSFAIILMGKKEVVALLSLSSWCLVIVVWLFLPVPWVCLQFVIVVFPDHTHFLFLLLSNHKGSDQPAHLHSLISTLVIGYLKSKVTRKDLVGLQHVKASVNAPGDHFRPMAESDFNHIQIVCQIFCVRKYRWRVQIY